MNFFKSVATTVQKTVAAQPRKVDAQFERETQQFFEVERVLQALQLDIKRYSALWGDLIAQQTKIFANLLYFYDKDNIKREIVDDLLRNMQLPMDTAVSHLERDIERDIQPIFHKLLTPFARVRNDLDEQKRKQKDFEVRFSQYSQLVAQTKRSSRPEWGPVAAAEESQRGAKREFESCTRKIRRAFRDMDDHKTSMLDDILGHFLNAESSLFHSMVTTHDMLKTKSLHLQYHLKYPSGIRNKIPPPDDVSKYVDARQFTPDIDSKEVEQPSVEATSSLKSPPTYPTARTPPPPRTVAAQSPVPQDLGGGKPRFPSADFALQQGRSANVRQRPPPPRRDVSPNSSLSSDAVVSLRPRTGTLKLAPGEVVDMNTTKFYFYPRGGRHPLGLNAVHLLNFQWLHTLLDPSCTRNAADPGSSYPPNAVPVSALSSEAAHLE